jgi:hypothetical protein
MADLEQNHEQATDQRPHLFKPGQSGNLLGRGARKHRIAAKAEELAAEFGGLHSSNSVREGFVVGGGADLRQPGERRSAA